MRDVNLEEVEDQSKKQQASPLSEHRPSNTLAASEFDLETVLARRGAGSRVNVTQERFDRVTSIVPPYSGRWPICSL